MTLYLSMKNVFSYSFKIELRPVPGPTENLDKVLSSL